jgi:predicted transcriptional regulator
METLDHLRDSMQRHKGDWVSLAREAGVSYAWVTKFMAGDIPDPRVSTVCKLTEAIAQRESRRAA